MTYVTTEQLGNSSALPKLNIEDPKKQAKEALVSVCQESETDTVLV